MGKDSPPLQTSCPQIVVKRKYNPWNLESSEWWEHNTGTALAKYHQCSERMASPQLYWPCETALRHNELEVVVWHCCFTEEVSERRRVWKSAAKSFFTCSDCSWELKVFFFFPYWFFSCLLSYFFLKLQLKMLLKETWKAKT